MFAFQPEAWTDFFVAEVGATAAILGLMVVAISINIDQILEYKPLPGRAGETVAVLAVALTSLAIALVPAEDARTTGWILFGPVLIMWLAITIQQARSLRRYSKTADLHGPYRVVMVQLSILPFVLGTISLITEFSAGFYLLAFGGLITILVAVGNAWVVLIEIRR